MKSNTKININTKVTAINNEEEEEEEDMKGIRIRFISDGRRQQRVCSSHETGKLDGETRLLCSTITLRK